MGTQLAFSPLRQVEAAFRSLSAIEPKIVLDLRMISPDLPDREVDLDELTALVHDRSVVASARDLIWGEIISAAQTVGQPWTIVAAGLMIRSLRAWVSSTCLERRGERADIEAQVLLGFVEGLRGVDPAMRRLSRHLMQLACQRAIGQTEAAFDNAGLRAVPLVSRPGHPDLVLARAVEAGALTSADAELIGRTRIEEERLLIVARQLGLEVVDCIERRDRAEAQLAWFLGHKY
jgi:hypothetical protein